MSKSITIHLTEREVESLWSAFALFSAEYEGVDQDEFNRTTLQDMKVHDRIVSKIRTAQKERGGNA